MEKCYDYLNCNQPDCIMYKNDNLVSCWEMEGTKCFHQSLNDIKHKMCKEFCKNCTYYKYVDDRNKLI